MVSGKTAVILINVGTPDSPLVKDVRRYLSEFLNDPRIIDIPLVLRKILVNLIIVPFRASKSAKLYKLLWTEKGSPLLFHSKSVKDKLQVLLGDPYTIFIAMRYGNPNIRDIMEEINQSGFSKLIVVPMFPHYASSSSGTAVEAIMQQLAKWTVIPEVKFTGQFYNHPQFIEIFAEQIRAYHPEKYEHIIFSYHGLPLSHIARVHPEINCESCTCDKQFPVHGTFCYRATCYETSRLLAANLGLPNDKFSQSFQSGMSNKWLKPFTDKLIIKKAEDGIRSILVVAPSFVTDCLETNVELGVNYKNLFIQAGGKDFDYVESLNDSPAWIETLKNLIEKE